MCLKRMRLFLFVFVFAGGSNAYGRVAKTVDYVYYTFSAENATSLLYKETRAASPIIKEDGKVFLGHTEWKIRWNYKFKEQNGVCRISSHTVLMNAVITLPKLIGGTSHQHAIFNDYLQKLKAHELRHVAISMKYANEIDRFLSGRPSAPTCGMLKGQVREAGHKQIDLARAANRRYDLETEHGKTEGVTLRQQ